MVRGRDFFSIIYLLVLNFLGLVYFYGKGVPILMFYITIIEVVYFILKSVIKKQIHNKRVKKIAELKSKLDTQCATASVSEIKTTKKAKKVLLICLAVLVFLLIAFVFVLYVVPLFISHDYYKYTKEDWGYRSEETFYYHLRHFRLPIDYFFKETVPRIAHIIVLSIKHPSYWWSKIINSRALKYSTLNRKLILNRKLMNLLKQTEPFVNDKDIIYPLLALGVIPLYFWFDKVITKFSMRSWLKQEEWNEEQLAKIEQKEELKQLKKHKKAYLK